ncbi:MAG TPA: DUF63 family protein [Methanothrix sp.]|nr:DUF63 family protein [Methanothrix sp.]
MNELSALSAFIQRYYIDPIIYDTSYNPVDTITWALILGLAVLGLIRLLGRAGIAADGRLVAYTLPYILAGSSLRVIEDADMVAAPWRYLLITPLIFFLVFLVTSASLFVARRIWKDGFYSRYAAMGFIWTALNLALLSSQGWQNLWVIPAVFLMGSGLAGGIILLERHLSWLGFLEDKFSRMILYAHMLDAAPPTWGWTGFSIRKSMCCPHIS